MTDELIFVAAENAMPKSFSGGFAAQVLVVLPASENVEAEKIFLKKVFSAVQIDFDRDALCLEISAGEIFSISKTVREKLPEKVLVFGFSPPEVGMALQVPMYQSFLWGGVSFLFSENLNLLENDRDRKTKLWAGLKAMFF